LNPNGSGLLFEEIDKVIKPKMRSHWAKII